MRRFSVAIIFLVSILSMMAVPARPGLMTVRQSDGTEVRVRLMGDEHHHFHVSEDGYLVKYDNGVFYYASAGSDGSVVRSDFRLTDDPEDNPALRAYLDGVDMEEVRSVMVRSARRKAVARRKAMRANASQGDSVSDGHNRGLFPGSHFPTQGEQKGLVILVEFADKEMETENAYDYFNRMLNEEGFSLRGGTGSARDFFRESSMDKFLPEFDVYGPVKLRRDYAFYGKNTANGEDIRPAQMIIDACKMIDEEVDFSQYDRDGDGYIDNVFVFYAGMGEASGGDPDTVWPHSWNVTYYTMYPQMFDGVQLDRYACSNEWEGSGPDGVGTFIHEFSHVMGLPDLYPTYDSDAFTSGAWSGMDYGTYNNRGRTPPYYTAFERYALGWLEPMEMDSPDDVVLESIGTNMAGIIRTENDNEYFLVENRQKKGWDRYIPGHGMLVWHIDYDERVWEENTVNNDDAHQHVDLIEADNIRSESTRGGDAFPGTARVTSFTAETKPALMSWAGDSINAPLTDIRERDGVIYFKLKGGKDAAVGSVVCDAPTWRIEGGSVVAEGLTAGTDVRILDMAGKPVAQGVAASDGTCILALPPRDCYILQAGTITLKIML